MTPGTTTLVSEMRRRFGDKARPADEDSRVAGVLPRVVCEPDAVAEVSALLSFADTEGLKVLIRGGGTKESLGFPPAGGDILLSTRGLNRIVEYTPHDLTVTVQTGVRLVDLQGALAPAGQWLALDASVSDQATIGGLIASNVSGPRRLRYGGVRDQLLGVQLVLADGTIARGGGKVVKNVAGYDLPKLFTGALGTLGVVTEASFRVYPRLPSSRTTVVEADSFEPLAALAVSLIALPLAPTAIDLFDRSASRDSRYQLAVRFESQVDRANVEQSDFCAARAAQDGLVSRAIVGSEEEALWQWGENGPPTSQSGGALAAEIKVSLAPTALAGWLAFCAQVAARTGVEARWRAHAGHGIVVGRVSAEVGALVKILEALRADAAKRGGSLIVTAAAPALASRFDVWGTSPALDLMRQVKARFDPRGTLNPGRFIGKL